MRTNLWYDGVGRVWQRWNDNTQTGDWDETLMRYVYDGNTLAQEHQFSASGNGMWIYNYVRYDRDYLHKPDGVRQRSYVGPTSYTDEFLFRDMADIASKVPRGSSATVTRAPRMASGERTPENDLAPTTSSFTDISRLGAMGSFTECYGGGTTNPRTQGFDGLLLTGTRHYLAGLGRYASRLGNNAYLGGIGDIPISPARPPEWWDELPPPIEPFPGPTRISGWHPGGAEPSDCPACCQEWWNYAPADTTPFCWHCCGTSVEYGWWYCPEIAAVVGPPWCQEQCCEPGRGPSKNDIKRLIFDECVFIDKQMLLDLVDQLKKWADNLGLGKLGSCLALCLAEPPGLREGCIVGCIADYYIPGAGDILDFYKLLFDAFPMIGPECCAKIANRLRDQYDVNWDLSEGCCSANYTLIAESMNGFEEWMRKYWCCYYCSGDDYSGLLSGAIGQMEYKKQKGWIT